MFDELNRSVNGVMPEDLNCDGYEFKKIGEFEGKTLIVDGFFFNDKGDYGREVVVVAGGYKVNMPRRAVEQFEKIVTDPKMAKAVMDKHLSITNIKCNVETPKGKTTAYKLADC